MNPTPTFATVDDAREIARRLYPDANDITMIEHSHDNIVALIDNSYAVRFPRDKNAHARSQYEAHILRQLEYIDTLEIPRILDNHTNPPYMVTSFVLGGHISSVAVRSFSDEQKQAFGKKVAQFAYTMHTALSLENEIVKREELGLDELEAEEPWPIYYKRVVDGGTYSTNIQTGIARKCYTDWVKTSDVPPSVVVHDDLHTENMMFDGNMLTGVIDFGDANVGTPEQELRQMYRISEEVMLIAVREYERLSGKQLSQESLRLWAAMKELADYSKALAANNTSHHSFKRASRNLNTWYPDGKWGEGYDLSGFEAYQ